MKKNYSKNIFLFIYLLSDSKEENDKQKNHSKLNWYEFLHTTFTFTFSHISEIHTVYLIFLNKNQKKIWILILWEKKIQHIAND